MSNKEWQVLLACGSRYNSSQRELYFVQGVCADDDKQYEELSKLHYPTLPHGDVSELIVNNKCKNKKNKGQHDDGGSGNTLL